MERRKFQLVRPPYARELCRCYKGSAVNCIELRSSGWLLYYRPCGKARAWKPIALITERAASANISDVRSCARAV